MSTETRRYGLFAETSDVKNSSPLQPLRLWDYSVRPDQLDCGWNRELSIFSDWSVRETLAAIVGARLGDDVTDSRLCGTPYSRSDARADTRGKTVVLA